MLEAMVPAEALISGRWRLERLIGQGGMSDVYRAKDEPGGGTVAVKIVRSSDPLLAQRLAQEAKALASFDHPGLVRVFDSGVHREQAYLVMELVDGPTLSARLRRGPLSPARVAALGSGLAEALAYVHDRGIVHRDLKPANVLLGPGARVRLADFGIARLLDASSMTVTGSTLGTAAYMAPEQIEHHSVGTEADIWSLGLILLESLLGKRVFEGTPAEVVARRLAGPLVLPADLPTQWRMLLETMVDDVPQKRPAANVVSGLLSAPAFRTPWRPSPSDLTELGTAAGPTRVLDGGAGAGAVATRNGDETLVQRPDPTVVAPTGVRPRPNKSRRPLYVASALCALALLAGLVAWAATAGDGPAHASQGAGSTHRKTGASSTSTSASTTTTPITTSSAAAKFVNDIQSGIAGSSLSQTVGNTLMDQLNKTLADSGAGSGGTDAVSSDLGKLDATIANGAASGNVSPAEATVLTSDVATLSTALGASPTLTTSTTTAPAPTPAPAPGPAQAPGGGPKHSH